MVMQLVKLINIPYAHMLTMFLKRHISFLEQLRRIYYSAADRILAKKM